MTHRHDCKIAKLEEDIARRRIDLNFAKAGAHTDGRRFTAEELKKIEDDIEQMRRDLSNLKTDREVEVELDIVAAGDKLTGRSV